MTQGAKMFNEKMFNEIKMGEQALEEVFDNVDSVSWSAWELDFLDSVSCKSFESLSEKQRDIVYEISARKLTSLSREMNCLSGFLYIF